MTFRSGGEGQTPQGASSLALVSEYTGWCGRSRLGSFFLVLTPIDFSVHFMRLGDILSLRNPRSAKFRCKMI